jgi:hypothetical protein
MSGEEIPEMIRFYHTVPTVGDGVWSKRVTQVQTEAMRFFPVNDDLGELRIYFDLASWNVEHDGLIYTDSLFLREIRSRLAWHGFNPSDVNYSEQGLHGKSYVSFDVGPKFIKSWYDPEFGGLLD